MKTNKKIKLIPLAAVPLFFLLISAGLQERNPFPETERYKLKNGLEVIFADYGELPVTSLTFFVNAGQKSETPGQQGLASLTADALTLGNEKYSRVDQDRLLHRMAASISSGANKNFTTVSGEFLNRDVEKGMDLLAAVLLKPAFPQTDVDELKNFELTQNKPAKMDINELADVYGDYFTFGIAHPLGRHFYEAQFKKVGVAQLKEFYSFNYTPGNTKLVVSGKPDRAQMKKLIEQYFGNWTAAYGEVNGSSYDIPAIKSKEYAFINKDGATQACLFWIKKSPAMGSKDEIAFELANRIFSDRLGNEIREKRGYTYGIYSNYSDQQNEGVFRAQTQVRNEVMYSTIEAYDLVLSGFYTGGATEKEMNKIRTQLRNQILGMEEPGSLAAEINPWVYRDYEKRKMYIAELDAIDLATVNKIIKKYFSPDAYKLMIAGSEKALDDQLNKIPKLQKLELNVIEKDY